MGMYCFDVIRTLTSAGRFDHGVY